MVEHVCKICNKVFNKKSTYNSHILRKNPCKPPDTTKIDFLENKVLELEKKIEKLTKFMESLEIVE